MQGTGGAAMCLLDGWFRLKIKWKRNQILNSQGQLVPDPQDNPPQWVYLKTTANCLAYAIDYGNNPSGRNPQTEIAKAWTGLVEGAETNPVTARYDAVPQVMSNSTDANLSRASILRIATQGAQNFYSPWIRLVARSEVLAGRSSSNGQSIQWNQGSGTANIELKAALTNYYVDISSDIQPSWRKHEGALPPDYTLNTDAFRLNPGLTPQIWRLKNKRNADGSITVDSVALWLDPYADGHQPPLAHSIQTANWFGGTGNTTANYAGFNNPNFHWSLSGGSLCEGYGGPGLDVDIAKDSQTIRLPKRMAGFAEGYDILRWPVGINLGGFGSDPSVAGAPNSLGVNISTISVTTTDSNLSLTNTYQVNWHKPIDNPVTAGAQVNSCLKRQDLIELISFHDAQITPR